MSNELIILENLSAPEVFRADKVTEILNYVEQRIKEFVPDESTPAGLEAIDEFAWKITKSKTLLKKMGDDYAKYLKEEPKKVDIERKRIVDTLETWAKQVRKPLTDREEAEKARKEGHEAAIVAINGFLTFHIFASTQNIERNISDLRTFCASRDWQEYMPRATAEYTQVNDALTKMLAEQAKKEADHAELERLRKEEEERNREKREKEIAEKATKDAEERAAKEAQKVADETAKAIKAEQEKVAEADRRAQQERDQAAANLVAIEKRQADAAIAAAKEQAAREADIEHRAKINHAIILGIVDIDRPELTTELATVILEAIAGGKIPNVSIHY